MTKHDSSLLKISNFIQFFLREIWLLNTIFLSFIDDGWILAHTKKLIQLYISFDLVFLHCYGIIVSFLTTFSLSNCLTAIDRWCNMRSRRRSHLNIHSVLATNWWSWYCWNYWTFSQSGMDLHRHKHVICTVKLQIFCFIKSTTISETQWNFEYSVEWWMLWIRMKLKLKETIFGRILFRLHESHWRDTTHNHFQKPVLLEFRNIFEWAGPLAPNTLLSSKCCNDWPHSLP